MSEPPVETTGDKRGASDAVADLAQRLLRENTLLRDEIDRLNRVIGQRQKCL